MTIAYFQKNIFCNDLQQIDFTENQTLFSLCHETGLSPQLFEHIVFTVNGETIEDPKDFLLKESDFVRLALVPAKGDKERKILGTVASIALMTFAPQGGEFMTKFFGITGKHALAYGKAIFLGIGTLAINAVFKPPIQDYGTRAATDPTESPNLTIEASKNGVKPYGSMISVWGEHRYAPDYAAQPYTVMVGDDQYLYLLFDAGLGDVEITQMFIGQNFLQVYEDYKVKVHRAWTPATALQYYTNDVQQDQYALSCSYNVPQVITTIADTNEASIDILFTRGLVTYDSNGNRGTNTAQFTVKYRAVGSGVWIGIFGLNFTTTNKDVLVYSRQTNISVRGIDPVNSYYHNRYKTTYGIKAGTNYCYLLDYVDTPEVGDFVEILGTVYSITEVGSVNTHGLYVEFVLPFENDIALLINDAYGKQSATMRKNPINSEFTATKASSESFTIGINLPFEAAGQYEIQVTRTTPDETATNKFSEFMISALRSIKKTPPIAYEKPRTIVELVVKANDQLNGLIDEFRVTGKRWLPVTTNGTSWTTQFTNNPAWIAYHVLTGNLSSRPISTSRIDMESFLEFANWCDQDDGSGNAKYTCNFVLDYSENMRDLVDKVLGCGRATLSRLDGKIGIAIDKPKTTAVNLVCPRNSFNFGMDRIFYDVPHALKTQFIDKDSAYGLREVFVYRDGYTSANATKFEEFPVFGITDNKKAWREGRYRLAEMIHRSVTYYATMDIENLRFTRGDLAIYSHDVPRAGGLPFRVRGVSQSGGVTKITSDEAVLTDGVSTYSMWVRNYTGGINSVIVTQTGTNELTLAVQMLDIQTGDLAIYGKSDTVTRYVLVKDIEPQGDSQARISFVDYAPAVFTADTGTIPDYTPLFSLFSDQGSIPPALVDITITEIITYQNRYPFISIGLNWVQPPGLFAQSFEIYVKDPEVSENYFLHATVNKPPFVYLDTVKLNTNPIVGKTFYFKIIGVSARGKKIRLSEVLEVYYTVQGDQTSPETVQNFAISPKTQTLVLSWDLNSDVDIDGYEIRRSAYGSADWDTATVIKNDLKYTNQTLEISPASGDYMIKAIDTTGNYSTDYALYQVNVTTPETPDYFIDANEKSVTIFINPVSSFFPIAYYEIVRDGEILAQTTSTVFQDVVSEPGTYLYRVFAIDTWGQVSGYTQKEIDISALPTYSQVWAQTWSGGASEFTDGWNIIENAIFDNDSLGEFALLPVSQTLTWEEKYADYETWQDFADEFEYVSQGDLTSSEEGRIMSDTFSVFYGENIGIKEAKITVTADVEKLGDCTVLYACHYRFQSSPAIMKTTSYSQSGVFVVQDAKFFAVSIKVYGGEGVAKVRNVNISVEAKLQSEFGTVSLVAGDNTFDYQKTYLYSSSFYSDVLPICTPVDGTTNRVRLKNYGNTFFTVDIVDDSLVPQAGEISYYIEGPSIWPTA